MKSNQIKQMLLVIMSFLAGALVVLAGVLGWPPAVSVAAVIINVIFAAAITASIQSTQRQYTEGLAELVKDIKKGNLSNPQKTETEDGETVAAQLYELSAGLKKYNEDINQTLKSYNSGSINVKLEEKNYDGAFRETVKNINASLANNTKDLLSFTEAVSNAAEGEFRNTLTKQAGEKEKIYNAFDALVSNSKKLIAEIGNVKQAVTDGGFSYKADGSKQNGEWLRGIAQLNDTLSAASAPVSELQSIGERMSRGEFGGVSSVNYKGDYAAVFQAFTQASNMVSSHNKELLAILEDLARYTPGRSSSRDYNGGFPQFKQAVSGAYENIAGLTKQEKPAARSSMSMSVKPAVTRTPEISKTSVKPAVKPAVKPSAASSPTSGTANFVDAKPNLGNRTVKAPSAAKVYDAKDFGKY